MGSSGRYLDHICRLFHKAQAQRNAFRRQWAAPGKRGNLGGFLRGSHLRDPAPLRLALSVFDNTLLAGDSDHAWGDWLCRRGILDEATYKARDDTYYEDYQASRVDITTSPELQPQKCSAVRQGAAGRLAPHSWPSASSRSSCARRGAARRAQAPPATSWWCITATNRFVARTSRPPGRRHPAGHRVRDPGRPVHRHTADIPCSARAR